VSAVADAVAALAAALAAAEGLAGLRVYTDPSETVDPPAVVVGPPSLTWEGYGPAAAATFPVFVVVALDERALQRLWELVPAAQAALEETEATARSATPIVFNSGGQDLPAYEITTDYPL
jgi:hypothetical protein